MPNVPTTDHATGEPAVFLPENLLERAATMMDKDRGGLPRCCLLDFDAELRSVARERFGATPSPVWPCFHTTLLRVRHDGTEMEAAALMALAETHHAEIASLLHVTNTLATGENDF